MPTQSRGHGTRRSPDRGGSLLAIGASRWNRGLARCAKPPAGAALFCVCRTSRSWKRERIRGLMRPGLFSARRAPFRQTACKKRRESLAEAQSTQRKTRGTRFDLRLLPFVALQTFEILSACEDFIERSGFSPSLRLGFLCVLCASARDSPLPPSQLCRRVPCPRLCVGMSSALRRAIDRFDEPQAASVFRRNGRRQKQENVSERAWPASLSRRHVLRCPFIEKDASQGAGRTISGYDILPRIQGHAHAKPWAWHPAQPRPGRQSSCHRREPVGSWPRAMCKAPSGGGTLLRLSSFSELEARTDTRAHAARAFLCKASPVSSNRLQNRRESLAEAQSTQRKTRGTRFDLRLLPFIALQTFEIVSACEDFIERSGFLTFPRLGFLCVLCASARDSPLPPSQLCRPGRATP